MLPRPANWGPDARREVPVRERDGDTEDERDDRERHDEQRRRQDEQDALALLAPDDDLADAQGDRPQDVGVHRGLPVGEPEVQVAQRVERLGPGDEQQDEEGATDEQPTRALAAVGDALVGDDMDEPGGAHVPGLAHEDGGHATGAALRGIGRGAR